MIPGGRQARTIFLAILLAVAIGVPNAAAAPSDPTVRVEPARLDVRPGEDFEVRVMIIDVEDLGSFELSIAYDPSVIELKDAGAGDFLGSTGRMAIPVGPQIDEEEGIVALGALGLGEKAGPNGSGVLATITGTARGEGSSALRLEKVHVFNTGLEALSVELEHGEVTVNGADAGPSETPDPPARTARRSRIVAVALLAVVAAAAVAFAVPRGKPQEESEIDSG